MTADDGGARRAGLSIGDFSRATHLSIKALRHYHRKGVLIPAEVDGSTGYRYYRVDQITQALLVKRFRDLGMPLERIASLLNADDVDTRTAVLQGHLETLIDELARMRTVVSDLGELLRPAADPTVEFRSVPAVSGAAVHGVLAADTAASWFHGVLAELSAVLRLDHATPAGPAIGIYTESVFTEGAGQATVLLPTGTPIRERGRVGPYTADPVELCIIRHEGGHDTIDVSYARLGAYVADHEISLPAPIREHYIVGPRETEDESAWITEIGWPVFRTRPA